MEGNSRIAATSMNTIDHALYMMPPRAQHTHAVRSCYQLVMGILEGLPPAMKVQFSLEQFLAANTFLNEKGEREAAQPWPMGRGDGPPMRQGLEDAESRIPDPESIDYARDERHLNRQLAFIKGKKFVHASGRMIPHVSQKYQSAFNIITEVDQLGLPSSMLSLVLLLYSSVNIPLSDFNKRKAPKDGLPSSRKCTKMTGAAGWRLCCQM